MSTGLLPIQLSDEAVRKYVSVSKEVNHSVLEEAVAKEQAEEFINFINYLLSAGKDNTKQDDTKEAEHRQ